MKMSQYLSSLVSVSFGDLRGADGILKYSRVNHVVLWLIPTPFAVDLAKLFVGELSLRVFVQVFHVGMGGSVVDVKVHVLDGFSMVSFGVRQAKEALLEDVTA